MVLINFFCLFLENISRDYVPAGKVLFFLFSLIFNYLWCSHIFFPFLFKVQWSVLTTLCISFLHHLGKRFFHDWAKTPEWNGELVLFFLWDMPCSFTIFSSMSTLGSLCWLVRSVTSYFFGQKVFFLNFKCHDSEVGLGCGRDLHTKFFFLHVGSNLTTWNNQSKTKRQVLYGIT